MPAVRTALRGPGAVFASHEVRALVGFCLLGAVNVVLPAIIFSASYLIIPYSRPTVILIEGLSSLATKLILPHVLCYIAWWARPCVLTSCWILAAVITSVAPPNVAPPIRILMTMLASSSAAAAEVSFLAQMRYYGRWGLAGWGVGTGIGGVAVALMPYVVSSSMGMFLRSSVDFVYYLVGVMLAAYLIVLPPVALPRAENKSRRARLSSPDEEESIPLIMEGDVSNPSGVLRSRAKRSFVLVQPLLFKYITPMTVAFTLQSFVFPAAVRLQPMSTSFGTFAQFKAAFGAAFQIGSLISRSSILLFRWKRVHPLFLLLGVCSALQLLNAVLLITSNTFSLLLLASSIGVGGGAIYMTIMAATMDYTDKVPSPSDGDFCIGMVSSGETGGLILGSLIGAFMEMGYCASDIGAKGRWCLSTR